ncbi:ABC transporter substrate-binding protein [Celerinatantimonas sp. YJH-8]|uniref:ABC transporter substrate-binding protein n=1 Tax=Celerinatantimonas sp. YJH-8 TaxID=3228714 RepID=UPI0038CA0C8D
MKWILNFKSHRYWLLFVLSLVLGNAQAQLRSSFPATTSDAPRRVVRYDGIQVSVPEHIQRVASAWEAQNSVLVMLGAGSKIVATTRYAQQMKAFRQIVPSIKDAALATLGHSADVNVEGLIALHPDILFVSEGFPAEKQRQLERAGIAVAGFHANSIQKLVERVGITGELLGGDAIVKAQAYQRYFEHNRQLVAERLKGLDVRLRKHVYIASGMARLTSGRPSLNQDWIDLAGGINVAEQWHLGPAHYGSANVDLESIMAADPDVIIAMRSNDARKIAIAPKWHLIRAVQQHRVYANPRGLFWWCRETSEEALQFLWLAKVLYPDRFSDIDMTKQTADFYQRFYGTRFSDIEIREFLHPKG